MTEDFVVTLRRFPDECRAEIARLTLDQHGIPAMVSKDDCGGWEPYLQPGLGVRLLVHNSNAAKAIDILNQTEDEEA